jgi:hypothetical protein
MIERIIVRPASDFILLISFVSIKVPNNAG